MGKFFYIPFNFENVLEIIIPPIAGILELIGVLIIAIYAFISVWDLVAAKFDLENVSIKLKLAKALELGLEFKLAAEILKTVIIRSLDEIIILSAVVILRVILTFVIHWEISNTKTEQRELRELRKSKEFKKD